MLAPTAPVLRRYVNAEAGLFERAQQSRSSRVQRPLGRTDFAQKNPGRNYGPLYRASEKGFLNGVVATTNERFAVGDGHGRVAADANQILHSVAQSGVEYITLLLRHFRTMAGLRQTGDASATKTFAKAPRPSVTLAGFRTMHTGSWPKPHNSLTTARPVLPVAPMKANMLFPEKPRISQNNVGLGLCSQNSRRCAANDGFRSDAEEFPVMA
jgi:hypothetical protein